VNCFLIIAVNIAMRDTYNLLL